MIVEGVVSIAVVGALVEVLKQAKLAPKSFLPLLAVVLGIVLGIANSYVGAGFVVAGALQGLIVGVMASGAYDLAKSGMVAVKK